MLCYGDIDQDQQVIRPQDGGKGTLQVAFCANFNTNIVCLGSGLELAGVLSAREPNLLGDEW
jgi:hypothetical protein